MRIVFFIFCFFYNFLYWGINDISCPRHTVEYIVLAKVESENNFSTNHVCVNDSECCNSCISKIDPEVNYDLAFDFSRIWTVTRNSEDLIIVQTEQVSTTERILVMITVFKWGWNDGSFYCKKKKHIVKAVCYQVTHDFGFKNKFTTS